MSLNEYKRKRDFERTLEPAGEETLGRSGRAQGTLRFVVQKHDASKLHYDFRLERDGVLLSWAIPKGPSLDPRQKRLAVRVEDHPLEYASFEGCIAAGQYGAGTVLVWDFGTWQPETDLNELDAKGELKFRLDGTKLNGRWMLVRLGGAKSTESR
ncbi:MAG: hypothetical protein KDA92_25460, partial [Planctomycetales bacterium]|nr:hypothetical protein [Planctomycetales bacterium]